MGKYFGTDGIRGVAFEKLNAELAYRVGQGIVIALKNKNIVIGMDTRLSSPMLAYTLASGALAQGANVTFAGVVSTPMVALYAKDHEMTGVMITASHNPYHDNGIKVFNKGYKTTEADESLIEDFIDHGTLSHDKDFGKLNYSDDVKKHYMAFYDSLGIPTLNQHILYDSAQGANYQISKILFDKYAKYANQFNNTPDGLNINVSCGSTHMNFIQEKVTSRKADVGFAFDGDGDRVLACDQHQLYDGDLLIYILATYFKEKNELPKDTVVLTKMNNPGIIKALKDQSIKVSLTDVGDKYVVAEMTNNGYTVGGENSGHIIISHILHSGDGLLVAMLLLKIMTEKNMSLYDLTKHITLYPQKMVNIKGVDKSVLLKKEVLDVINHVKLELGDDALLLVRPSGTEPLIRVTISHQDEILLDQVINKIVSTIKKYGGLN